MDFEHVLDGIFGKDLVKHYREKCPIGWVDLMIAFESRKRSANPHKPTPLNVSLPFSFIDYCKKHKVRSIISNHCFIEYYSNIYSNIYLNANLRYACIIKIEWDHRTRHQEIW